MNQDIDIKQIITLNLKYGSSLKPLKTVAFAQLSAKALFISGAALTIRELERAIAKLIGVKNISENLIQEGLSYLNEIKKIKGENDKWVLASQAREEINKDLERTRSRLSGILKRHFPPTIDKTKLKKWFNEASAYFFSYFGEEWVVSVSKGNKRHLPKPKTIEELLEPSIKSFRFLESRELLVAGFTNFLSSENIEDHEYLMIISQAMFSARLVAADVGVDPLALEELKDVQLILDTNIFFAISLEKNREAKFIAELEDALKIIKARLVYLNATKEEYSRAFNSRKNQIIKLVEVYSDEVIKDTSDDMIATARARGCESVEDYERFFDSLSNIPTMLPQGLKIELLDDSSIEQEIQKAEKDINLKNCIQEFARKMRAKWKGPKKELALNHDAALLHIVRYFIQHSEKSLVLSLDRSLQSCDIKLVGPYNMPTVLSVAALIEVLAVNNAGPGLDSTNFAPLLSKIIMKECAPPINTYIANDLSQLYRINQKAVELPTEYVKKMIKEITRARMEGKAIGTDLQLKINRMYQEGRENLDERLRSAGERIVQMEESVKNEQEKLRIREEQIVDAKEKGIKSKALKVFIFKVIIGIFVLILGFFVLQYFYCRFFDCTDMKSTVRDAVSGLVLISILFIPIKNSILDYKRNCRNARKLARQELK